MRKSFQKELKLLSDELIEMGNLVEASIRLAVSSLTSRDLSLAKTIIESDFEINNMEKIIERRALNLILKEQPVAYDLRFISSSLKIITDMERIGDNAADISSIVLKLNGTGVLKPYYIPKMADATITIVKRSIDSLINKDLELVKNVIEYDLEVNKYFELLKSELIQQLKKTDGNEEEILNFLMIGKYLERIGDHAKNIAEWVYFAIEGVHFKKME